MPLNKSDLPSAVVDLLAQGAVIPAHPLALDADRRLDTRRQRAMTRYYLDAGAGGVAVGVHSTQFAIREVGLYEPVLELAMRTAQDWTPLDGRRPLFMVAGLAGGTGQAVREAGIARGLGYHAGLLSLAALKGAGEDELVAHCEAVAAVMPLVGFYLQPAVGGIHLPASLLATFRRHRQRGGGEDGAVQPLPHAGRHPRRGRGAGRGARDAVHRQRRPHRAGPAGAVHAGAGRPAGDGAHPRRPARALERVDERAVDLLARIHAAIDAGAVPPDLLALDAQVTDCNAALFDVAHDFHGCIAGCHEVLRRQGLLAGTWCLDPAEGLSDGQAAELSRVARDYPHLVDDAFVARHRERWLA
jgi:hypothetical protein